MDDAGSDSTEGFGLAPLALRARLPSLRSARLSASVGNWFLATALGGAKVQVSAEDADAAKRIVEAVEKGVTRRRPRRAYD